MRIKLWPGHSATSRGCDRREACHQKEGRLLGRSVLNKRSVNHCLNFDCWRQVPHTMTVAELKRLAHLLFKQANRSLCLPRRPPAPKESGHFGT